MQRVVFFDNVQAGRGHEFVKYTWLCKLALRCGSGTFASDAIGNRCLKVSFMTVFVPILLAFA